MTAKATSYRRLIAFLGSRKFLWFITCLLALQAAWIALSGKYPMAFDEEFHLGLIKLYAEHISPFWESQPASADAFGAITRDPSYLYHWLMSFPYRLLSLVTDNQITQILTLRFLNIVFLASAIPIYWQLLVKSGVPKAISNVSLLIFVMIPVVPLLAAQINYDNLWIPLVGYILLLCVNFSEELERTKRLNVRDLTLILILCMAASLFKYAFLPLFAAIALFLAIQLWRAHASWHKLLLNFGFGLTLITRRLRWVLLAAFLLIGFLFAERYLVNLVRYHKPVVDCAKVLSVERCNNYGPWQRDNFLATNKSPDADTNPQSFGFEWLYGMWFRLFFAVDGKNSNYATRGPLLVPAAAAIVFAVFGLLALLAATKRVYARYPATPLTLLALVTVVYVGALIADGYEAYTRTGHPVALNGRYLLPILPLVFARVALSFNELLGHRTQLKLAFAGVAVGAMVWGGGVMTFILRSDAGWYWNNAAVRDVNQAARNTLSPVVPGSENSRLYFR